MEKANVSELLKAPAVEVIKWAVETFGDSLALANSFSNEDIVVTHLLLSVRPSARIFSLDTGRLPEKTYECAERLRMKLGICIEWYFPETQAVENLIRNKGLYSFRNSLEERRECCRIRKVEPLGRALAGLSAWVTWMRRQQSTTRSQLVKIEDDPLHPGLVKVNPIADWTNDEVWEYIKEHHLPYNHLYDLGYTSIGCAPCTRPIRPGEDLRAGRWWWESPDHKECGLHALTGNTKDQP